uniref:Uncharacterized protein n=1 Tax=Spongospora subterranea TaxID=70186 RepID=A0A0H5RMN1_9EUKA|eukprot:CRZ09979.1 hypothetical protein [Spongospora subterranea]
MSELLWRLNPFAAAKPPQDGQTYYRGRLTKVLRLSIRDLPSFSDHKPSTTQSMLSFVAKDSVATENTLENVKLLLLQSSQALHQNEITIKTLMAARDKFKEERDKRPSPEEFEVLHRQLNAQLDRAKQDRIQIKQMQDISEKQESVLAQTEQSLLDANAARSDLVGKVKLLSASYADVQSLSKDLARQLTLSKEENARLLEQIHLKDEDLQKCYQRLQTSISMQGELRTQLDTNGAIDPFLKDNRELAHLTRIYLSVTSVKEDDVSPEDMLLSIEQHINNQNINGVLGGEYSSLISRIYSCCNGRECNGASSLEMLQCIANDLSNQQCYCKSSEINANIDTNVSEGFRSADSELSIISHLYSRIPDISNDDVASVGDMITAIGDCLSGRLDRTATMALVASAVDLDVTSTSQSECNSVVCRNECQDLRLQLKDSLDSLRDLKVESKELKVSLSRLQNKYAETESQHSAAVEELQRVTSRCNALQLQLDTSISSSSTSQCGICESRNLMLRELEEQVLSALQDSELLQAQMIELRGTVAEQTAALEEKDFRIAQLQILSHSPRLPIIDENSPWQPSQTSMCEISTKFTTNV